MMTNSKRPIYVIIPLLIALLSTAVYAESTEISELRFKESLNVSREKSKVVGTVVIENKKDGEIFFLDLDSSKTVLGRVIVPAKKWNAEPFEAANWSPVGVCATAVNAVHLKREMQDGEGKLGTQLISILPREMLTIDPVKFASYFDESSSVYTSIKAGQKIFGGIYTPFVGAEVVVDGEMPSEIRITLGMPDPMPLWVSFENRFGGLITARYPGEDEVDIGVVYRPVYGVGRFTGTLYCDIGRIRAVHSGVIDVSTSPNGEIGGFQIVPHFHADSSSVRNIRLLTQWMVIGPLDYTQTDYGLLSDLFVFLQPRFLEMSEENLVDGASALRSRFHVVVKFKGDEKFHNFPPLVGLIDDALESMEEIRIYFPQEGSLNRLLE
ncbi:MAG: hypothetical protein ABIG42_09885 [bacterium]